nr:hypothetical protein [Mucilaginibacter sp. L294]
MKKILLILFICCLINTTKAQTFSEWFAQNKTQKKYLIEQIAALKVYAGFLKKGYNIAHDGLTAISDIKNGDFGLHSTYFNSLKAVNPEVAKYPRVADILSLQEKTRLLCQSGKTKASEAKEFTSEQKDYFNRVYGRLNSNCLQTLNELEAITTSGKLEMKDDERLQRIDRLYAESQSQYGFAKSFGNDILLLIAEKTKEQNDLQTARTLYGIQ